MKTKCKAREQIEKLDDLMSDFANQKIGLEEAKMTRDSIAVQQKLGKDVLNHSIKFGQTKLCTELFVD
jgi:hypothetical protein